MNKIFFGLHVCAVFAAAGFVLHCSSADVRPDAGSTDTVPDGGGSRSGQTPAGELLAEPADIYFGDNGLVNCGTSAAPQTVTFTNNTKMTRQFKTKLTAGADYYTLSPDTVTVAPGQKGTMQIVPKTLPAKSAVSPELYSASLEVTVFEQGGGGSTNGTTLTNLRLHQTARGAIVKTTLAANPQINFGGVKIGTTANQTFSLTNTGNTPIDLGFAVGSPAFNVDPKTTTLAANGTNVTTVAFTPAAQQAYNDALVISNPKGAPLCDDLPGQTTLNATGTLSVGTSPGVLAFGQVNCGDTALPKTVTITNDGAAMNFTAVLAKGAASPYTIAADSNGSPIAQNQSVAVTAASTFVLRVVPKQVTPPVPTTPDGLSDTLTITTTSPGDAPHVVQLTQTARGAFLKLDKAQYQVKDPLSNHALGTNVVVSNTGNVSGAYTIAVAGRAGVPSGTFKLNAEDGTLAGGASQTVVLETKTPSTGWALGSQLTGDITLTPQQPIVLCSDAQPKAPVFLDF